ncbi:MULTISPECIES: IclR family transcriptional regulator [Pseudonocardia]|uniref:IclR family transcriptional regulator n=1 Tax=Pseudonocardia TaxID=1847 RepID=UPI001AD77745|nr:MULTISPECIES: IclR family transcriptional regulator [Pseudonocardia]MBO4236448.1 helix-turn-helix domain-containing protein [Pseudonocardia alni]
MEARRDEAGEQATGGGVQSIDRAVAILSVFSRARPIAGITEIARLTGLTRGTTHRLVSALASHGFMAQAPGSTAYSLGPRLLGLGEVAREQLSLESQALPIMTRLRDRTGETVGLHVLDAEPSRRTIAQVESQQPLRRIYTDLGAPRPPHEGAPGKALLAHVAPERLAAARARIADPPAQERLDRQIEVVRGDGYAISLEERVPGVVAVAVPVFDHTGAVAALSVSVPAVRAGRDELVGFVPMLREAADELSARLGGSAPPPAPAS